MKFLIDTDIVISFLRGVPAVVEKFSSLSTDDICISAMTKAELLIGPKNLKGKRAVNSLTIINDFVNLIDVIPFDSAAAELFADISHSLKKSGETIGDTDIIIAATALKINATLVTHNQKHFSRIKTLPCVDWQN